MQRSQALILDFDGTILDTEWPIFAANNELYAEFGLPEVPIEEWRLTIGIADHEMEHDFLGRILRSVPGTSRAELHERRLAHRDRLMAAEPVRPGIVEWIDAARLAGLPVGVASSSTPRWVEGNLERLGLRPLVDFVAATERGQEGKPAPRVYLHACSGLGIDPARAIAVDDSPTGLTAAIAAGMRCVTVPNRITAAMSFDGSHHHAVSLAHVDPAEWLDLGSAALERLI